jgi:hypothetical protein
MTTINLEEFRPDAFDYNTFFPVIQNVVPGFNSYQPQKGLSAYNANALPTQAKGLTMARTTAGAWEVYAATTTDLYVYVGGSWTEATRLAGGDYATVSGEFWRWLQYGENLICVNGADEPQTIDIESGSNFTDLGGTPPIARNITAVGEFVVLSGLVDTPYRIQWSAIGNAAGWTAGTDLSDYQDFPDGGRVTGVSGGETGFVLQEYMIRRMRFLPGSDYVFQFEKVVEGKGSISPYGFATVAGTVFFLAEDGFYSYSGEGLSPIGDKRVNKWFLDSVDAARLSSVMAVADPYRPRILWFYYGSTGATNFDRCLAYDWSLDRWAPLRMTAQIFGSAAIPAVSLDSLSGNLDTDYTVSFDSRVYEGGRPSLAAVDEDGYLAFMEGANLAATITTAEIQPIPSRRARVTECYAIGGSADMTIAVGTRETFQEAVTYGAETSREANTKFALDEAGRLHRYRITIPEGADWANIAGLEVKHASAGDA